MRFGTNCSNKWHKLGPWNYMVFRTGIAVAGASIDLTLGFKSEIHFCKHGFAPITSVKEEYCYMIFFHITCHKYSESKNMFCYSNTRNWGLIDIIPRVMTYFWIRRTWCEVTLYTVWVAVYFCIHFHFLSFYCVPCKSEINHTACMLQGFICFDITIVESGGCETLPPCKSHNDEYAFDS